VDEQLAKGNNMQLKLHELVDVEQRETDGERHGANRYEGSLVPWYNRKR